ncbi:uncharacterized protein LOC110632970 [Hevea brasiliensis]|uniref:uncharacterized protein LOC110632970 n=1 Tax=Hevea brasiliensis TaxID=3981 RepID=UPI0025D08EB7|nr:uncharacterized protein LOC110632970 [Hevea brasiliensis]
MIQQLTSRIDQLTSHNRMLENQIAQQASSFSKAQGKLPSQPENSREHYKVVILRSGDIVRDEKKDKVEEEKKKKDKENNESTSSHDEVNEEANKKKKVKKEEEEKYVPPPPYKPPLPYPQRFQKAKLDKQFGKFLKVLKKLYINISFTDVISQMPSYAKFLKEILSNKKKLEDYETVALIKECSATLHNKLPPKLKDSGSFSIPCHIGETSIEKALCDLGASVSLMPLSICEKLKVGDLKPTTISLQLADRSIKYPVEILENMPLKVGKFFIPMDFMVLEMEEDVRTTIILGRPFLATAGANIDVKNGKLKLKCEKKKSHLPSPFDKNETPRVKLKAPSKQLKAEGSSQVCKSNLQGVVGILNKATGEMQILDVLEIAAKKTMLLI